MQPIQPNNHMYVLPIDTLSEISSHLQKEALGRLSSVSQFFNAPPISEAMWKNVSQEQLPAAFKNLPGILLKEKFKNYHDTLKNKVNLVVENADLEISTPKGKMRIFPKNLLDHIAKENLSLMDKGMAISTNQPLIELLHSCYDFIDCFSMCFYFDMHECFYKLEPEEEKNNLEVFNLLLQLVDVNIPPSNEEMFGSYPLLFKAMEEGKMDIAKQLIDAGADLHLNVRGTSVAAYIQGIVEELNTNLPLGRAPYTFPQEQFDEIADYEAQKKAGTSHS